MLQSTHLLQYPLRSVLHSSQSTQPLQHYNGSPSQFVSPNYSVLFILCSLHLYPAMNMLTYSERPAASVATKPSAIHLMGKAHSVPRETQLRHIWIITGPAGCGKSTVAQFLAKRLNLLYIEGDDVRSLPPIHWDFQLTNTSRLYSSTPNQMLTRWPMAFP